MKELPFIDDKNLFRAVDLALWLYLDKNWNLKNSINKAAEKHNVKPKISIERLIRAAVPEEVFWDRMSDAKPTAIKASQDTTVRQQKLKKLDQEGRKHVNDIVSEKTLIKQMATS